MVDRVSENSINASGVNYSAILQNVQAAGDINITLKVETQTQQEKDKLTIVLHQHLVAGLIEHLSIESIKAKRVLDAARRGWQENILQAGKILISSAYAGVVGQRLKELLAMQMGGSEFFTEYVQNAYLTARTAMELVNFMLLSALLEAKVNFLQQSSEVLDAYLNSFIPPDAKVLSQLQGVLFDEFQRSNIALSVRLKKPQADVYEAFQQLYSLYDKRKDATAKEVAQAEIYLAIVLSELDFLTKYKMASVKEIKYEEYNRLSAYFLAQLGKMEGKMDYRIFEDATLPKSVLIYADDLRSAINLFPFVIDFNQLEEEKELRICFYSNFSVETEGVDYWEVQEGSTITIECPGRQMSFDDLIEAYRTENKHQIKKFKQLQICKAFSKMKNEE